MEAVLLWSRSIRGLTACSRADALKSGTSLNANVGQHNRSEDYERRKIEG